MLRISKCQTNRVVLFWFVKYERVYRLHHNLCYCIEGFSVLRFGYSFLAFCVDQFALMVKATANKKKTQKIHFILTDCVLILSKRALCKLFLHRYSFSSRFVHIALFIWSFSCRFSSFILFVRQNEQPNEWSQRENYKRKKTWTSHCIAFHIYNSLANFNQSKYRRKQSNLIVCSVFGVRRSAVCMRRTSNIEQN